MCAAIAGTGTAAAATGRISWSLALSGTVCWLPLIALQLVTAAVVIVPIERHFGTRHFGTPHLGTQPLGTLAPLPLGTLFNLFFQAHAPWSLWVLTASAFILAAPGFSSQTVILATAIVPLAWTSAIVFAYFREVQGLARPSAIAATAAHQALTVAVILAYVAWAVQLWPRLLALQPA